MDDSSLLAYVSTYSEDLKSGKMTLIMSIDALRYLHQNLIVPIGNNSVINKSNSTCDQLCLRDTIKKLKNLTLCPGNKSVRVLCRLDLCCFPELSSLEFKNVEAEKLDFSPNVVNNLKHLKCSCGPSTASILFKHIHTLNIPWNGLNKLDLSHCGVKSVDANILLLLPNLYSFDISWNFLTTLDISGNPKLTFLNASGNMIESIPFFSINEVPKLKILLLNDNLICDEGLSNLKYFESLEILKLANNILTDHICLSQLSDLYALKDLSLDGNPMCLSRDHRISSVHYLHENVSVNQFVLDHRELSKEEKLQVGRFVSPSYTVVHKNDNMDESFEILLPTASCSSSSMSKLKRSSKKSRDALINETTVEKAPRKKLVYSESPKEHLETKVMIENIRDRFGEENWLHNQAGSVMKSLMGLEINTKEMVSAGTNTSFGSNSNSSISVSTSPLQAGYGTAFERSNIISIEEVEKTKNQEFGISILPENDINDSKSSSDHFEITNIIEIEEDNTDIETNYVFTATREDDNRDVFLVYNELCLKEKDSLNLEKFTVWPLRNITSCSQLNTDGAFARIFVTFNSIRPTMTERIYFLEVSEANLFCSLLRGELENRSLSSMNQIAYQCIKCSAMFSIEKNNNNTYQILRCQSCGSTAVLEMEDMPLPFSQKKQKTNKNTNEVKESNEFVKSPSQSSIGSANSLKTKGEVPMNNKYDSDIEVISNPSQSSVEVLEVLTRKKSSEERQLVNVLELVTVSEQGTSTAGLTESSSSGSLTDSICTAYDGSRRRTIVHDETTALIEEVENQVESKKKIKKHKKEFNLESLLQDDMKSSYTNEDLIEFNYSDYTQIDHRLKLHLLTVFFNDLEDIICALKCHSFLSSNHEGEEELYESKLFVFSTTTLYIFKMIGVPTSNDISSWLKPVNNYSVNQILNLAVLPNGLGFLLSLNVDRKLECCFLLLYSSDYTENFAYFVLQSSFFRDCNVLLQYDDQIESIIENSVKKIMGEKPKEVFLYIAPIVKIFNFVGNKPHLMSLHRMIGILLTESKTQLECDCMKNLFGYDYSVTKSSEIRLGKELSNLISIGVDMKKSIDDNCYFISLNFENEEGEGIKESWSIGFIQKSYLYNMIQFLKKHWENIFEVKLYIYEIEGNERVL